MDNQRMFNLEDFACGALSEQVNAEIEKVLKNISDPNTDSKKSRKITVNITMKPNSMRNSAAVTIETKSALAPVIPMETNIMIDKDLRTGLVVAAEFGSQHRDQIAMDIEAKEQMPETNGGVIDMRKAAK